MFTGWQVDRRVRAVSFALAVGFWINVADGAGAQQVQYSTAHLNGARALPQVLVGDAKTTAKLSAGRSAISVVTGNFHLGAARDLVTGYAVQGGGGAITMQSGTPQSGAGEAFGATAVATALPVQPDWLMAADVDGNGTTDVVAAAKGGSQAYVLYGDGAGGFAAPVAIALQGSLTAAAVWTGTDGTSSVAAGVCVGQSCAVQVIGADGEVKASMPLAAAATSIAAVHVDGGAVADLAVVSGGTVVLVHGASIAAGAAQSDGLQVAHAVSVAEGNFVWDRRGYPQLAVMDAAGTLHVMARTGLSSRAVTAAEAMAARKIRGVGQVSPAGMGWSEVETLANVASGGAAPLLLRARVSGSGGDDLLVSAGTQFVTVRHAVDAVEGTMVTTPSLLMDASSGGVVAMTAARLNADGRYGVVTAQRTAQPQVTLPTVNRTFNVNTTTDALDTITGGNTGHYCVTTGVQCTIRDAIGLANQDSAANRTGGKIDTVNVPAGTYTLSYNTGADANGDATYHFEVEGPINVVGAGAGATIIDGGQHDKIFSIDDPYDPNSSFLQVPFDTFFTGLTLQNAKNNNSTGANPYGGIMDWDSDGGGYLTIASSTLKNSIAAWGPGGAVSAFSATFAGPGVFEMDSSTVTGNSTPEVGGGLDMTDGVPLILNATTVSSNLAQVSVNTGDGGKIGEGGGIYRDLDPAGTTSSITNGSVVSGNQASEDGGGLYLTAGPTISGTSITGNSASRYGGGAYLNGSGKAATFTSVTLTGNSAGGDGGGLFLGSGVAADTEVIHYSRIHGNTTSGAHTGIGLGNATSGGTVNATDNWWGCNGPASGTGCDTAGTAGSGTVIATPYTLLKVTVSTANPVGGATFSATGGLGQDSAGTTYSQVQDAAYLGVPATLAIVQHGGATTNSTATTLDVNASITTSATASQAGAGTATITVDGTSVVANFAVLGAPTISESFAPTSIGVGGVSAVSFTLTNPSGNSVALTGVGFTDPLPPGLTVATPNGLAGSCGGGTISATAGSGLISLSGATLAASGSCTFSVNVTAALGGSYTNTTGSVTSTNGGTGTTATATLLVDGPPTATESFTPTTIAVNGTSAVTFTITNPVANPAALTGVALVDTLPTGLVVATPNGVASSCGGATTAAGGTVSLNGGTLAVGASCTITVNVTSATANSYTNTGSVTATNGGTAAATPNATLVVAGVPTLTTAFGASTIALNGKTTLSYTVTNPNSGTSLTGVSIADSLPAGLVVSTPNGVTGICGGGTITATAGSGAITLSGATLAASASCNFSVSVTGMTAGLKTNSATPSATTVGAGTASVATVTVVAPPTITLTANPTSIALNGSSTLTYTFTNPNASTSLTGVGVTTPLPAGLLVATPTTTGNTCGATVTAAAGSGSVTIASGTVPAGGSCTVTVKVTGTAAGTQTVTTGSVNSTEGGLGLTATATITVIAPATETASFVATTIPLNGTTPLTVTISNPNTGTSLTGLAFTDLLPAGLVIATPNGASTSCGGTLSATAGGTSLGLTGGTLAASATCTVVVSVKGVAAGLQTDTVSGVSSNEGGTGTGATASVTVVAAPTIAGAFGSANIQLNANTSLTFTITNPNTTTAFTGLAFTDVLPTGLVVATPSGVGNSCGGTLTASGGTVSLSAGALAAGATCTVALNVTGTTPGLKSNSETVTSTQGGTGNTATQSVTVALGASKLVYTAGPASPIAVSGNAGTVQVAEEDSLNNVTTGAGDLITLTVTGPSGYSQQYTATAVNGVSTFNLSSVPLTLAGTYTYTATSGALTQAQAAEVVNAGAATAFHVTGLGSFAAPGIGGTVTVTAVDSYGNTVTGFTGTVTLTSSDALATLPGSYTFVAGDNGSHTFSVTLNTAGTQSVTATSGVIVGSEVGVTVADAIWLINADSTLARLTSAGAQTTTAGAASGTSTLAAVAFDQVGDVWAVETARNGVQEYSRTGTAISVTGSAAAGVSAPTALAIDGLGQVWVANGNNSISVLSNTGTAVTGTTGVQGGSMNGVTGIAIDNAGSVWVTNSGNNSVTKVIGAAAPVVTPTVTGTTTNTLGTRP